MAETIDPGPPVVALVGSAGGIGPMGAVLAQFPPDFPAAVLVLLHLAAAHRSHLAAILARRTTLPVKEAEHGDVLKGGAVYVAAPDAHMIVAAGGTLRLEHTPLVHHVRPSADSLLLSLAEDYGGRCVAVVFSGTGSDGAAGAAAVKRAGGTVFVQDEASSDHFGMPSAAILAGEVDGVLATEELGRAVIDVVASPA
ncbi:MAG TPA: chemotaxis protein CheB [Gaiellaceae bacterium]|nr:chemotaxis protein CheB [Gaiellaceae bacterium]